MNVGMQSLKALLLIGILSFSAMAQDSKVPPPPSPGITDEDEVETTNPTPLSTVRTSPTTTTNGVVIAPASPLAVQTTIVAQSALYETASQMPAIYTSLVSTYQFSEKTGHTRGAAILANCAPELTPEEKAEAYYLMWAALVPQTQQITDQLYQAQVQTKDALSRRYAAAENIEVDFSVITATLVCKKGSRKPAEMVTALFAAYTELKGNNFALQVKNQQPRPMGASLTTLHIAASMMY